MCISFMSVFLCFYVLFAVCVNGPLWTDFQINGHWLFGCGNTRVAVVTVHHCGHQNRK